MNRRQRLLYILALTAASWQYNLHEATVISTAAYLTCALSIFFLA